MKRIKYNVLKGWRVIKPRRLLVAIVLLAICVIPSLLALQRIKVYRLPVGGDLGGHLKMSYAIFENSRPMWGQQPMQYPPLLYFVIYPLCKVLGEILALDALGLVLLALRPLAVFIFASKIFKNQYFALLGAAADAFFPSYFEMYAFGGYPNLLGFVLLPLAFTYILQASASIRLRNLSLILLLSSLTILAHHLTSIIFLLTICVWLFYRLLKRDYKICVFVAIAAFSPAVIYRLLVNGASDFVFFNESAYYGFNIGTGSLNYVFKDEWLLAFLIVLSIVGLYELSRTDRSKSVLLLGWLLAPLLFYTGASLTRILAIDNVRMLFFLVQPMILAIAYALKVLWEKRYNALVLGLSTLLLASSVSFGVITLDRAIVANKATLESKYSDVNSYDLVAWIKNNVQADSVLVTRAPVIGRYIEGMDHIRILRGGISPKYLFKQGEYERNLATDGILTANIFGYSDMFKIKDSTPFSFDRTPSIYVFSDGDYRVLGYFSDHYRWEMEKLTLNVSKIIVGDGFYEIHYSGSVPMTKAVTIKDDQVTVSYKTQRADVKLDNFLWLTWGKKWKFQDSVLSTDYGNIQITTNATAQMIYDSKWDQWKINFQSWKEQRIVFKVENKRMSHSSVVLTTREDLINQYEVNYILLRKDDTEVVKWVKNFPAWKSVYSNKLFGLYSLQRS